MKTIKSILISLLFIPVLAFAHEPVVLPNAGITPESAFYFVDKLGEALREFFTFNSDVKAHLQIDFAAERIAEIKIILEMKGVSAKGLEVAQARLRAHLGNAAEIVVKQKNKGKDVSELAKSISDDFDANKEALKQAFKDQERALEAKEDELKAKIREARRADDTAQVEALVKELGEIKAQKELLELKEDEQEEALEQEEEKIEREMEKKEDAEKAIKEAEEERREIVVMDGSGGDDILKIQALLLKFDKLLAQAKELFAKENYVGAKQLAKQAEKSLEKVEEAIEDLDEAKEEEEELKKEQEEKQQEEAKDRAPAQSIQPAKPKMQPVLQPTAPPPSPTKVVIEEDKPPVLKNLSINMGPWDRQTNRAGDIVFSKNLLFNDGFINNEKAFLGFGEFEHTVNNPDRSVAYWWYLSPGTKVRAAVDGVVSVGFIEHSKDWGVAIAKGWTSWKAPTGSKWIIGQEHLVNLVVKDGDIVKAGDILGEASPRQFPGEVFGFTELEVWTGGTSIMKYCPFDFLDESLKPMYKEKINQLAKDWEEFIGKDVHKQEEWVAPGCALDKIKEK